MNRSRTPPNSSRASKFNDGNTNVVTGKNLVRAMVFVGLASAWVNIRYHVYHISPLGIPLDGAGSTSTSTSTSIEESIIQPLETTKNDAPGTTKKKKVKKTLDAEFAGGQLVKKDKKGNLLVQQITALKAEDLGDAGDVEGVDPSLTLEEASKGREPIMTILREAGIQDFDAATVAKLPTWDQVEALYGKGPVVYGLDTCEAFRKSIPAADASIASAGIFNSGTNTLAMYMNANCIMPENKKEKYGGKKPNLL